MVKAVNIEWDTEGTKIDDLPEEVDIPDDINENDVADYLSDSYGWCVLDLNIVEV